MVRRIKPGWSPVVSDDPIADRLIYAGFPVPLKEAMKAAAKRWTWDRETWRYQTLLIQDAMNRVLVDDLVLVYRTPPALEAA